MRVLHVWDQAGVASVLAKWQKSELGYETHVIKNIKHDKMGITKYYGGELVKNKYIFVIKAFKEVKDFDIIHLHDAWFLVKMIHHMYPKKKMVMHYHGSFVRMNNPETRKAWENMVDALIVATPDLLDYKYEKPVTYVPTPIDIDLFKPITIGKNNNGFTYMKWDQSPDTVLDFLKNLGYDIKLDFGNRNKIIQYDQLPSFLKNYEYYIDYPTYQNKVIKANSCLGLQAMSLGLNVISWDGSIRNKLPEMHRPIEAITKVKQIYETIL